LPRCVHHSSKNRIFPHSESISRAGRAAHLTGPPSNSALEHRLGPPHRLWTKTHSAPPQAGCPTTEFFEFLSDKQTAFTYASRRQEFQFRGRGGEGANSTGRKNRAGNRAGQGKLGFSSHGRGRLWPTAPQCKSLSPGRGKCVGRERGGEEEKGGKKGGGKTGRGPRRILPIELPIR